ncbi:MAG: hypothetical protein ABSF69_26225 [Polyangiaceae bacterium]|jgi:hypothetical protein
MPEYECVRAIFSATECLEQGPSLLPQARALGRGEELGITTAAKDHDRMLPCVEPFEPFPHFGGNGEPPAVVYIPSLYVNGRL